MAHIRAKTNILVRSNSSDEMLCPHVSTPSHLCNGTRRGRGETSLESEHVTKGVEFRHTEAMTRLRRKLERVREGTALVRRGYRSAQAKVYVSIVLAMMNVARSVPYANRDYSREREHTNRNKQTNPNRVIAGAKVMRLV